MAYIECPECGQRALSVATRCPRCGFDLPPQSSRRPVERAGLQGFRAMLAVVGVLVAGVVVLLAVFSRTGSKAVTRAPVMAPVESVSPVVTESAPPTPVMPRGSSGQAAQASPAEPPPAGRGVRRYAQTWVNVRQSRNVAAPAVRVLNPGEAVLVDSLRGGWYRVLAEGRTVGYVYRSRLDSAPPTAP